MNTQPNFKTPVNISFKKFPDGEDFVLHSIDSSHVITEAELESIAAICSEDLIYDVLFKERLKGDPYLTENAKSFIAWAKEGWTKNEWFVFLIRDSKNNIVGAVDIKSANLENAEVGYWLSSKVTGVMANAVSALCSLAKSAGFKSLYGLTVLDNLKSQNVLIRAGFTNVGRVQEKGKDYLKFVKNL